MFCTTFLFSLILFLTNSLSLWQIFSYVHFSAVLRAEVRGALQSVWLYRAYRRCKAGLRQRWVCKKNQKNWCNHYETMLPVVSRYCMCILASATRISSFSIWQVLVILICRWRQGRHQCQCLSRHQCHYRSPETLFAGSAHSSHHLWRLLQIHTGSQ